MVRWNLVVSEKTDRAVRSHLARTGGKEEDLSTFVDQAVRKEILRRALDATRLRNLDLSA